MVHDDASVSLYLREGLMYLAAVVEKLRQPKCINFIIKFGMGHRLKFSREHNFFCYISNLEHRLFSIFPLTAPTCEFYILSVISLLLTVGVASLLTSCYLQNIIASSYIPTHKL